MCACGAGDERLCLPFFIDEAPLIGGIDFFAAYEPHELYLLEVCSQGLEIHAYTHRFRERMARKPKHLFPFFKC